MKKKAKKPNPEFNWRISTILFSLLFCILAIGSVVYALKSVTNGIFQSKESFLHAYNDSKGQQAERFAEFGKEQAEQQYHVSNNLTVVVEKIQDLGELEVLPIRDTVYIVDNTAHTKETSWLKATGEGAFTINLRGAEFVIDSARGHVLIRTPKPSISAERIKITEWQSLLYKNNRFSSNGSVKNGEDVILQQANEAQYRIQTDILSNQQYFKTAEASARAKLIALVYEFTSDIKNLQIDVEFI